MGIITIAFGLAFLYLCLQCYYVYHWLKIPIITVSSDYSPSTKISVIIVTHNEEENIEACIRGILNQDYPPSLFEVIVVNDRSSDGTEAIIRQFDSSQLTLLNLSEHLEWIHPPAFKKSGIELGVHHAKNEWIVVTDADCAHPAEWLRTVVYTQQLLVPVFLTAPIQIRDEKSLLGKMQEMENLTLMLITSAGIRSGLHDIANGANMSFSKNAFLEVGGYKDNYQFASGDDMFLIEKMRLHFPCQIAFIKSNSAAVISSAKKDWNSLISQRIRWAGKNKGLHSPVINVIWGFVGLYHIMLLISFLLSFFLVITWWPFLILIIIKWIADFVLVRQSARFFKNESILFYFIPLQLMYMIYILILGWNMVAGKKSDW